MYEEILDVAEELFMKQGYNDTSTRQIAKILGITQPNIYYHFKNKENIYYQVMQRLATEVGENLRELSAKNTNFEEKIMAMAFYLQQRHPFSLFMMMHDIQHTLNPETAKKLFTLWQESYKQPFINVFEQNSINIRSSIEPEFAVSQLFILISAYLDMSKEIKTDSLKKAMHIFFYGVLKD
ncbi:TetR/AcrR family transcriptional regulator [Enterococcus hulanensis]|uniref:TetR/AcrR family transcriptional regulator n=1 Tax=Enterococcus hulanensis TaxID=2559929 RepID=UPI00288F1A48|nr:TetR/AcrR family transcriptional regulator [Enterococcus hulanensis]MDT2660361.1 TetR/AcrR family transcriptional regulator [Enterococcus hulanensis]